MALISLVKRLDKNGRLRSGVRKNPILFWMYYGFFAKVMYYPQNRRKRVHIQKHGRELLQHVYILLTAEEVTFFVDFGTLLGIIREERLLGHDLDIDFGVIIEDAHTREKVQRALKNGGCELKKHLSSMAMSLNSLTLIVALNLIFAFMKMRLIIPSVICSM
jgi:hypothetical protein